MSVRWFRLMGRVVAIVLLCGILVGCGGGTRVEPPAEKELAAAREGRAAVVMLRAVAETTQGGEHTAFGPEAPGEGKSVSLVRLDAARKLATATLRSPNPNALRGGWAYLVLKPGVYYLQIHDPVPGGLAPEVARPGEDWLLEVPAGDPLVYAGTVVFARMTTAATATATATHPGDVRTDAVNPVVSQVRDDSTDARRLGSEWFPELGSERGAAPRTLIVRRYTGPTNSAAPAPVGLSPSVRADGAPTPRGYAVQAACAQDGARLGLLYGDPILSTGGSSTNSPADLGLLVIKVGLYAWAGTGAIAGSVSGVGEAREVQPCVEQAVKWFGDYDLAGRLSESLVRRIGPSATCPPARDETARPVLRVTVQDLQLRPCAKAHLACVEAKVRLRLWDPAANRHLADRVLVYSSAAARYRSRPYGRPLPPYIVPVDEAAVVNLRALARLPAAERREHVEAELDRAVGALTERIAQGLYLPQDPGSDAH